MKFSGNMVEGLDTDIPSNNSNRFQQLELNWVDDRGCFGAMEFR